MRTFLISASILALVLTGCLRSFTTVTIHANGTAHIVDTMLFAPRFFTMMENFTNVDSADGGSETTVLPWSDSTIHAEGRKFGQGVNLEAWMPLEVGTMRGYVATYMAQNIHWLRLDKDRATSAASATDVSDQDGNSGLISESETGDNSEQRDAKSPVTFTLADDVLTIHNALPSMSNTSAKDSKPKSKQELLGMVDMMSGFLAGMKLNVKIKTDRAIATTNATYVSDNTITLVAVDFDKLIAAWQEKPSLLTDFDSMNNTTDPKQIKKILAKYPPKTIELETQPEITVRF